MRITFVVKLLVYKINKGQVCCSGTRTFVHADIYDEFVAISKKLAEERKIGCPTKNDTEHGPLVSFCYIIINIIYKLYY